MAHVLLCVSTKKFSCVWTCFVTGVRCDPATGDFTVWLTARYRHHDSWSGPWGDYIAGNKYYRPECTQSVTSVFWVRTRGFMGNIRVVGPFQRSLAIWRSYGRNFYLLLRIFRYWNFWKRWSGRLCPLKDSQTKQKKPDERIAAASVEVPSNREKKGVLRCRLSI